MSVGAAVNKHILELGGGFMFSREARAYAADIGLDEFFGPYIRGRGGVLGDVDADVVTAAFGFFPGHHLRTGWESVPVSAEQAAQGYAQACQGFGSRKLGAFTGAERLAELLESVVTTADPAGLPLFAGWRAMALPVDPAARAMQLTHVLRELRGGLHLLAVRAAGITPLQAVLVAGSPLNDGPGQARLFGWPEPFEPVTDAIRDGWQRAESLTDSLIAPAFSILTDAEGAELVELVSAAHAATFTR